MDGFDADDDLEEYAIRELRDHIRYVNLHYPPEIAQKHILAYELDFYEADRETAMLAVTETLKRMFEK